MISAVDLESRVGPALTAAGYDLERLVVAGLPVVVGRRRLFRWRWFATQLKVTVVVGAAERISAAEWQDFLVLGFDVAKRAPGWPNGLQSGAGLVAVLVADQVDPAAAAAASAMPLREFFKGVSSNALLDAGARAVHTFDGRQFAGGVYNHFLRAQRDLVVAAVSGS